jgi:hypothetical protein
MNQHFSRLRPTQLGVIATAALLSALSTQSAQAANGEQLCAPNRAASVYTATATGPVKASSNASPLNLTPCASYTGYGTAELSTTVDEEGTVFLAPAHSPTGQIGVLRSTDNGVNWEYLLPKLANGTTHTRIQPYMKRDALTDRIFFSNGRSSISKLSVKTGFDLSYTDDGGDTWQSAGINFAAVDWTKILPGPPVSGLRTDGYPNNLYASGPTPISTPAIIVNPKRQVVMKSTDGGANWAEAGGFSIVPKDYGCPASEYILWGDGVVGADGTIYISGRLCNNFGLAISKDEGKTWSVKKVPGATLINYKFVTNVPLDPNYIMPSSLTIDTEGNLYAIWPDAKDKLRLSVSHDNAATWSTPVVVSDVGVTAAIYPAITVKSPGNVAIAYYGTTDANHMKYNGYVAESVNALDAKPVFKSTTVNDVATPMASKHFDVGYIGMFLGGDLNEIVQINYAPNGDLFTSFTQDMCPGGGITCDKSWDKKAHGDSRWQAILGRVIHN